MRNYFITGEDTSDILNLVKPGDILLRNFNCFLNIFLFREYFDSCLYTGKHIIVKFNNGKIEYSNLISFLRSDKILVLRINESKILNHLDAKQKAIDRCHQFVEISKNYDVNFNLECAEEFEVPISCYKELGFLKTFNIRKRKYMYSDFSLLNSPFFKIIYKKEKGKKYE